MKLRNKKTGETFNAIIREASDGNDDYELVVYDLDAYERLKELPLKLAHAVISDRFKSLAELNAEWEDYTPAEPLIKDEKIRQCVRLWAEINEFKGKLMYSKFDDCCSFYEIESQEELLFLGRRCSNLKHATTYTIAELCGEEEAPEPLEPTFIDLDERIREKEEE